MPRRRLHTYKVERVVGDFHATIKMHSKKELESFAKRHEIDFLFEDQNANFIITGGVLLYAEKKKRKKKGQPYTLWA